MSTRTLKLLSFILHSTLVATHVVLIVIWARKLEHRIKVSLENEKIMSYLITTTTTTCGTVWISLKSRLYHIYSAALVFLTQTLATRRSLQKNQILTAIHDNAAAWAGIGAAISVVRTQAKARVPVGVPIVGVLSVLIYLAAILGLHISSSSLFSLVTFNATRTFGTGTVGLVAFNGTPDSDAVETKTSQGLYEGTLYDLLDTPTPGNATVNASGFNISCGSYALPSPVVQISSSGEWSLTTEDSETLIRSTNTGMISTAGASNFTEVIFYSAIPIVDSIGDPGSSLVLSPPMDTSVASIQVARCSLSLVPQIAVVDSQTQEIYTLEPNLTKTVSKWTPYTEISNATTGNGLLDLWELWYLQMPSSFFTLSEPDNFTADFVSVADTYMAEQLNLPVAQNQSNTQNITLHDFENALSTLVASMFWTMGHIQPSRTQNLAYTRFPNGTISGAAVANFSSPILLPGNANIIEEFAETQLEVSAGLVVSILLMVVSLPLSRGSKSDGDLSIRGTGMLHAIWLYRNNPELDRLLEQVEDPTDENLREAGMRENVTGTAVRRGLGGRVAVGK
ncbi:hypothetical protein C8R45DRAFT_1164030 [Mycena sanguinolenta]|nr:hypothetical protein C8R45DRAFT_1164030 [Mycena sanguinolenta]